jgi:hypothetical protein
LDGRREVFDREQRRGQLAQLIDACIRKRRSIRRGIVAFQPDRPQTRTARAGDVALEDAPMRSSAAPKMRRSGLPIPNSAEMTTAAKYLPRPVAASFSRCTSGAPLVTSARW